MYLKLTKHAECSSRWSKMLYRHIKLHIVIRLLKSRLKNVLQAKRVCKCIFSQFLSRILLVLFSSWSKEVYLHGSCDLEFYIATYQQQQQKKMIRKTSFLNQEFLCRTVKIFKALNKREERWSNVGKTAVIILQIFRERSGALVHLLGTTNA